MRSMHKLALLAGGAALALGLGACQKGGSAGANDAASVTNVIKADETKWNDQFKSKDQMGLLSHYADDAFFVAPGVPGANGSAEIGKAYASALADNYFSLSFASDKIDVSGSGDMAYARGHFSEKYQDPKTKQIVSDSGTYLTVHKKQQDGSWKAVEDFAVADPATRKTEAPKAATPATKISMGL